MKNFITMFVTLLSIAFLLFLGGCNTAPKKDDKTHITMTVTKQNVRLAMIGHGELVIDWGDGNKSYESMSHSRDDLQWAVFEYTYQQNRDHDIKVYGQVTHLDCSENGLIFLDVTKGHLLQEIDIKTNLLTAEALDKLFLSLHDATRGKQDNIVHIGDNPGTYECDRNIAMKKDWMILCCGDGKLPNITMATVNQSVSLTISGARNQGTICWGDGNVTEVISGTNMVFQHSYQNNIISRVISIYAQDISFLELNDNGLNSFSINELPWLTQLNLSHNNLTSLGLGNVASLRSLIADENKLTNLTVLNNTYLEYLSLRNNEFSYKGLNDLFFTLSDDLSYSRKEVDITGNPGVLECDRGVAEDKLWIVIDGIERDLPLSVTMTTTKQDVQLTLAGRGEAIVCWGDGNETIFSFVPYNRHVLNHTYQNDTPHVITIYAIGLYGLICSNNELTNLNLDHALHLRNLICDDSLLTYLDVSSCRKLYQLGVRDNQLMDIHFGDNAQLENLYLSNNRLTNVDLNGLTKLSLLNLRYNLLENLDLSENIALEEIIIRNNKLETKAINDLFQTLHTNPMIHIFNDLPTPKNIYIVGNPGTNDCDRSIASTRGWSVYY